MQEKKTYRDIEPGELPCPQEGCDGILIVNPDNSYKLTCDKCGYVHE